ncbi:unnamed protein product [Paramecium pentaurelia]|uniref:Uncharacterized protein n=1 Tax=Paramecium pentaurelia TaxID=43138 RepID=A0A8S1Y970_9CILI|nr:unnamed protein product [Paramecium pentaurelia]
MKQVKNAKKIKKQKKQKMQVQKASQPLPDENKNNGQEDQSAIENYEVSFLDPEEGDYDEICDNGQEIQEYDDHQGAIGHFNIAIQIDPNNSYAYYLKSI